MLKKAYIVLSIMALTACSTTKMVETFPGTPGTASMAYCVRDQWRGDAISGQYATGPIQIMESRSGSGGFFIFDGHGNEMVRAIGTIGFWPGQKPERIEVRFFIPGDQNMSTRSQRRLALTHQCAALPAKEREDKFLPSVICTDLNGCDFRKTR